MEKDKQLDIDQLSYFSKGQDVCSLEVFKVRKLLAAEGLLRLYGTDDYYTELTREGYKAAETGIERFFDLKDQEKKSQHMSGRNVIINHGNQNTSTITDNSHLYRSFNVPSVNPAIKEKATPFRNKISDWVNIILAIITIVGAAVTIYFQFVKK
ncbi:hypothetical protein [Adhaeribacter soli]|uniref:Uncharacterized protein n=1 Tax=Adhaeribacter soli TaxID=2607655 RepID=A0A5N1IIS2_9BACT|nr:hypothetical protein [Adhaeribacter soli]KAA9325046.1 hypothetical protein F0P94_19265 [Adhaeribacter soli]